MACDSSVLKTSACTNGFAQAASDEVLFRALLLQLLCNISSTGPTWTSPNGTRYQIVVSNAGAVSTVAV